MSFEPRSPAPSSPSPGFAAGVLRVAWSRAPSLPGTFSATIVECRTRSRLFPRDLIVGALTGMIVRAPDGQLSRIAGVESSAGAGLCAGSEIGLLLVAVREA